MSRDQVGETGTFTRTTRLLHKMVLTADRANQLIEILNEMAGPEATRIMERMASRSQVLSTKLDAQTGRIFVHVIS